MNQNIFSKVDHYSQDLLNTTSNQLYGIQRYIESLEIPELNVSPNQGQFLHIMARAVRARRILEIGTFGGYNTIYLAKALSDNGKVISLETDPLYMEIAKSNIKTAGVSDQTEIMLGPTLLNLIRLCGNRDEAFDMIVLDAEKTDISDHLAWIMKLARPGALIVSNNVVQEGEIIETDTADQKVIELQKFLKGLSREERLTSTILQTVSVTGYDGMAISFAG